MKTARWIRRGCATIFVGGLAGIIASSAAGNNEGYVLTFGLTTAVAALILIAITAVSARERIDVFDEAIAEGLESQISEIVASGADEQKVRKLVRDAIRAGTR
jgi:hypothetical protein